MSRKVTIIIGVLLSCLTVAAQAQTTCTSCPASFPTVYFYVFFPNGTSIGTTVPVSSGAGTINTVRQVMVNAPCASPGFSYTAPGFCPYGGYISAINGTSAGSNFWELYINGNPASCGLDTCQVNPNDVVIWCVSGVSCSTALQSEAVKRALASATATTEAAADGESRQATIHKALRQRRRVAKD
jgi:hypothetical protein